MNKFDNRKRGLDHLLGNPEYPETQNRKDFFESVAESQLEAYCEKHDPSDGEAALAAISIYAELKLTPPAWAILEIYEAWKEYIDGYRPDFLVRRNILDWKNYKEPTLHESFHDALGLKKRDTRRDRASMKKESLMFRVYVLLKALWYKGRPIDDYAFEIVASNLKLSPSQCRDYYQETLDSGYATLSGRKRKKKSIETIWDMKLSEEMLDKVYEQIDF